MIARNRFWAQFFLAAFLLFVKSAQCDEFQSTTAASAPAAIAASSPEPNAPGGDSAASAPAAASSPAAVSSISPELKEPRDLWERMRNGFSLPPPDDDRLVKEIEDWYASNPAEIANLVERSKRYLYFIVDQVEKRGLPEELALLPMIESGFNPLAYSSFHAAGLWQLLPGTGKNFGLRKERGYDSRKDIVAGTDAALGYLAYLHDLFGDWELALDAYNAGEGSVMRALRKAGGSHFSSTTPLLPPQTRRFYSKLIAIRNIFAEPAKFGIELAAIHNHPYFTQVEAKADLDIKVAAKLAEIPLDEFVALNPGSMSTVWKSGRNLLLPADKAEVFATNFESTSGPLVSKETTIDIEKPRRHHRRFYRVRKGDSLDLIARRFKVRAHDLRLWNHLKIKEKLYPGDKLVIMG